MANMRGFFAPAVNAAAPETRAPAHAPLDAAEAAAIVLAPPAELREVRVRPHGTDLSMLGALNAALGDLPGASARMATDDEGRPLVDDDGCVTVLTSREGWVRFALERQGYVREVLPAREVTATPAAAGRGWR